MVNHSLLMTYLLEHKFWTEDKVLNQNEELVYLWGFELLIVEVDKVNYHKGILESESKFE